MWHEITTQVALEKLGRWPENKARKILEVLQINAVYSGEKASGSAS